MLQWFARNKPDRSDMARVDYALVSRNLLDEKRITEMVYLEEPQWGCSSDHRPFRIVVDISKRDDQQPLEPETPR